MPREYGGHGMQFVSDPSQRMGECPGVAAGQVRPSGLPLEKRVAGKERLAEAHNARTGGVAGRRDQGQSQWLERQRHFPGKPGHLSRNSHGDAIDTRSEQRRTPQQLGVSLVQVYRRARRLAYHLCGTYVIPVRVGQYDCAEVHVERGNPGEKDIGVRPRVDQDAAV